MTKNVLIIGASGDIGCSITKKLANEDYSFILHYYKNKQAIERLKESIRNDQIISVVQADLSKNNEIKAFLSQIVFPVDYIVFVSGTAQFGLFQEMTETSMDNMLTLHVKAPWMITKHLLPRMIQNREGKIVFITSIWGSVGASNEVIYSSVKGAQNSFVKALAKEVAPNGIFVNGISPGFIETKMNKHLSKSEKQTLIENIPINRAGLPSDIANTVRFLLSEEAAYITGEIIHVSGGW